MLRRKKKDVLDLPEKIRSVQLIQSEWKGDKCVNHAAAITKVMNEHASIATPQEKEKKHSKASKGGGEETGKGNSLPW